ncbi:MAG: hypothetical protein M3137_13310 [Actinomycetota bacterium]|nr:hypothetical protein [Actinomycetota bacterium]
MAVLAEAGWAGRLEAGRSSPGAGPLRCPPMKKIVVLAALIGASLFAAKKLRAS